MCVEWYFDQRFHLDILIFISKSTDAVYVIDIENFNVKNRNVSAAFARVNVKSTGGGGGG